jgi:3-phytase
VIIAASDRSDAANSRIALYRLDTRAAKLEAIGSISSGAGEAYGLCMGFGGSGQSVFAVMKDGRIREYALDNISGPSPSPKGRMLREFSVPSQAEGCVVDPRNGDFYVGEEAGGIWRFAKGATQGELVAPIDNFMLVADVEGLAIAPIGAEAGYLVASSQGDNAYAVFSLPGMEPVGRFRIAPGAFGSTEETDGIALNHRSFGPDFPQGLFVAQDGQNAPHAQNFKLVRWDEVLAALNGGPSEQGE